MDYETPTSTAAVGALPHLPERAAGARPVAGPAPSALRRPIGLALAAAALIAIGAFGTDLGLPAYETYRGLLFVHIGVSLVALGSTFAMPVIQPLAARGGVVTLRFALRFGEQLERSIVTPGSMLIIASGVGLVFTDMTGYSENLPVWLIVAMAWVAVVAVVAQALQGPALRAALAILEATPDAGPIPPTLAPIAGRMRIVGQFLSLSTIGVLFLMVWKPGA